MILWRACDSDIHPPLHKPRIQSCKIVISKTIFPLWSERYLGHFLWILERWFIQTCCSNVQPPSNLCKSILDYYPLSNWFWYRSKRKWSISCKTSPTVSGKKGKKGSSENSLKKITIASILDDNHTNHTNYNYSRHLDVFSKSNRVCKVLWNLLGINSLYSQPCYRMLIFGPAFVVSLSTSLWYLVSSVAKHFFS